MSKELKKAQGKIHITHSVDCPYCNETMYDDLDRDWWNTNVTDQLPDKEAYDDKYKINCKECGEQFIINGFIY